VSLFTKGWGDKKTGDLFTKGWGGQSEPAIKETSLGGAIDYNPYYNKDMELFKMMISVINVIQR
jgi:hypothetical protein